MHTYLYSIALSQNIGKFISPRESITLDEDRLVAEAAKVMRDKNTSCILVVNKGYCKHCKHSIV